jgi:hypothetical protein
LCLFDPPLSRCTGFHAFWSKLTIINQSIGKMQYEEEMMVAFYPALRHRICDVFLSTQQAQRVGMRLLAGLFALIALTAAGLWNDALANPSADYFRFESKAFGFDFEVQADWQREITDQGVLLLYGPAGTSAEQATAVLQILDKARVGPSSEQDELLKIYRQVTGLAQFTDIANGRVPIAGGYAPFFTVSYIAPDEGGNEVTYRHTHLALENESYYFLLSFRAPETVYTDQQGVFAHIVATFAFPLSESEKQKLEAEGAQLAGIGKGDALPVENGWYRNEEYKYAIHVPEGWAAESGEGDTIQIYPSSKDAAVIIFAIATGQPVTMEKWIEIAETKINPEITYLQDRVGSIAWPHPGTGIAGSPMIVHEYSGHHMNAPVRSLAGYSVHDERVFIVSAFCETGSTEKFQGILEVVQGFRLTE